ncbi:SoxR reducing system RseC family protein [Prolixibacteraceae bacterium Z1-6]|uniref:SoxR reducing system RseC family protein n=1 Tax=Draconibacterium aestuarii TaxID=2998507 RepID=A0A9X3F948_9BACT|nr:SoxR reducing system RseC family protein [Prolixibacteraceae bacterium Z1-6]
MQSRNSKKQIITESDIRHRGFVTKIKGTSLLVNIVSQSACSTCHAKGACTVADYQDKEIEVTEFHGNYKTGDEVTILFKQSKGFTAVIWGYVVPFFLVLLTLIATLEITGNELHAGLLSLAILIPYYITLYFFRDHLKKVLKFEVEENV